MAPPPNRCSFHPLRPPDSHCPFVLQTCERSSNASVVTGSQSHSVTVGACKHRAKHACCMIKGAFEQSVQCSVRLLHWSLPLKNNTPKIQHCGSLLHVYTTKSSASRMRHPFSCSPPAVRAASCFCHDCPLYRSPKGK